jgi:hypothetical protein
LKGIGSIQNSSVKLTKTLSFSKAKHVDITLGGIGWVSLAALGHSLFHISTLRRKPVHVRPAYMKSNLPLSCTVKYFT